jgi:hypothetical protein
VKVKYILVVPNALLDIHLFGELFSMFGKMLKLIYLGPFKMENILGFGRIGGLMILLL